MRTEDIANLLGIEEERIHMVLGEDAIISSIKTVKEIRALYCGCSKNMKPAVLRRWEELTIPFLETKKDAKALYNSCPIDMEPAVIEAISRM